MPWILIAAGAVATVLLVSQWGNAVDRATRDVAHEVDGDDHDED